MLIIPAIDIRGGAVVRLTQGKFDAEKVYSRDPIKTARHWAKLGAEIIHVVDLDGAKSGISLNLGVVKEIARDSHGVKIEFGGGVRKLDTIENLLSAGVFRVVLGTRAAEDNNFLKKAFLKFKNKVIISVDARDGMVSVKGWNTDLKKLDAIEFAKTLKAIGFKELIYTDIAKDGTLRGPNIKAIKILLKETGLKVIGSGGISNLEDVRKLKMLEKSGLTGIIVGKALYEARFTLPQALKVVGGV
jgi:phosphoribosylformimino-5-aminoimidazole carboxamide ribotide isomerase